MSRFQNKFFKLLEKKKYNIPKQEEFMKNPLNIFQQKSIIQQWNLALKHQYNDKELNNAAKNAQSAYTQVIITIILSFILAIIIAYFLGI